MSQKPPPYFPQGSLSPPNPKRYRRFKMIVAAIIALLLLLLIGAGMGAYYLFRSIF